MKNDVLEKVNLQLHDKLKQLMREQRELRRNSVIRHDDVSENKEMASP